MNEWRFSYSRWTGVWFGPIPVGLIVGGVIAIGWTAYQALN